MILSYHTAYLLSSDLKFTQIFFEPLLDLQLQPQAKKEMKKFCSLLSSPLDPSFFFSSTVFSGDTRSNIWADINPTGFTFIEGGKIL
jgi:hypothetical protein